MTQCIEQERLEILVLDHTGHSQNIWDPNQAAEVETARELWNSLKKKGYVGYRVNADGSKGVVMPEFDPHAGKVIMSPPLAGG